MEKWFLKQAEDSLQTDYKKLKISKFLYKILVNRGINSEDDIVKFLNPSLDNLNTPLLLPDLIKASNIILSSINKKEKIRIMGDYDVDGVMSTYILYKGLLDMGADIDFRIPSRVKDGYGINKSMIDEAANDNIDLILTCDNGIAAIEEVDYCINKGIKIIVTDHHEPPLYENKEKLPRANALVDPKIVGSKYPFKDICGAFVAFKLIEYLVRIQGMDLDSFYKKYLEFAAIATVCDVMPLKSENRDLLYFGLKNLNETDNVGLRALIEKAGIRKGEIDSYHIGFIIGPTINSSGRLETAYTSIKLLLEEDYAKACEIANYLRELNAQRQKLTNDGFKEIENTIEKYKITEKFPVLILRKENLEESVVGIIAGKIKEKYNHPTIVLTRSGDLLKGSGRSIDSYNMFEKVSEHKDLLERFGGHAMACGLSLREDNFKDFVVKVNNSSQIKKDDLVRKIYIDVAIDFKDIDNYLIFEIEKLKPFGNGNPRPLFVSKNLSILDINVLGKNRNVIKILLSDGKAEFYGLLFKDIEELKKDLALYVGEDRVESLFYYKKSDFSLDIIYTPVINTYKGLNTIQLNISNYRVSGVVL
ncbi:single-stranded-DNA-specific exonuclease RecJ [Peptoniphilus catoniae]|uniref:single-stranded-DNA-specific exonuclease RecJ n=1 Tax=Peptoniphilus catoniae TaxID=1660341 RepID=UPI0010FDF64C|nr:single-stranded-DNA-specific exonuclease RecJ [Peptoniphilus catoniae]